MKNQQYQYLCLVEELRKRLQDGELQSGSAIPSEAELAKALSLSKREVRPLLKNLEIAGILSGSRDGTYTLAKEMSDSMRELMHVMFLVQNISPLRCVRCAVLWNFLPFRWHMHAGIIWIWTN